MFEPALAGVCVCVCVCSYVHEDACATVSGKVGMLRVRFVGGGGGGGGGQRRQG